jgi:hypothetical protein
VFGVGEESSGLKDIEDEFEDEDEDDLGDGLLPQEHEGSSHNGGGQDGPEKQFER